MSTKTRRPFRLGIGRSTAFWIGLIAATGGVAAGDVVLHPGTVSGTVGLTNASFASGRINISTRDGAFLASTQIANGAYSITSEGNQIYDNIQVSLINSTNGVYESIDMSYNHAGITIPRDGSVTVNLTKPGGTIDEHIDVTGGSVASASFGASWSDGSGSLISGYASGGGDIPFAFVAGDQIVVSGSASINVLSSDGISVACTTYVSFAAQTFTLAEGATVTYTNAVTVDPSICVGPETGVIKGLIGLHNVPGGTLPSVVNVEAFGPTVRDTILHNTANPVPDLAYELDAVPVGSYFVSVDLSFPAPYSGQSLSLPYFDPLYFDVASGASVDRNFVFDGAVVVGTNVLTGPAASFLQSEYLVFSGDFDSNAPNYGPTAGGIASTNVDLTTGNFSAFVTAGGWQVGPAYYQFFRGGAEGQNYSYVNDNRQIDVTVNGGTTYQMGSTSRSMSEGVIVFDVVEPAGTPTIGIDNPTVYAHFTDASGNYVSGNAYLYESGQATPAVHFFGPPGTYTFDAYATVHGSTVRFASSTITLGAAVNTEPGSNVTVVVLDGNGQPTPVALDFQQVTGVGQTSVSVTDVGPAAPQDYSILAVFNDNTQQYATISSSASFTGPIEVCIKYDPVALGISAAQEASLKLQQFANGSWTVINGVFAGDNGGSAVNTTTHTICGLTTTLGTFAITKPDVVLTPPTDSCVGAPTTPAQLTTDVNTCTASIDNTNQIAGGCAGGGGGLASCTFDGAVSEVLTLGGSSIAIMGTAIDGSTSTCTSYVTVADRELPSATCPAPVTVECAGAATPHPMSATCGDNCGTCAATCGSGPFQLGVTSVACNATDGSGNTAGCNTSVTVVDTSPPTLTVRLSVTNLRPADHRLVPIVISTTVADACDPNPVITCTARSSEGDTGECSGDREKDIQWINGQLLVRAERSERHDGRIYLVTCVAKDTSGNQTTATATIKVPVHDDDHGDGHGEFHDNDSNHDDDNHHDNHHDDPHH